MSNFPCPKHWSGGIKFISKIETPRYNPCFTYNGDYDYYTFKEVVKVVKETMKETEKGGKDDTFLLKELYAAYQAASEECRRLNELGVTPTTYPKTHKAAAEGGKGRSKGKKDAPVKGAAKGKVAAKPKAAKAQPKVRAKASSSSSPSSSTKNKTKPKPKLSARLDDDSVETEESMLGPESSAVTKPKPKPKPKAKSAAMSKAKDVDGDGKDSDKDGGDDDDTHGGAGMMATKKIGARANKNRRTSANAKLAATADQNKRFKAAAVMGIHKGANHQFYGSKVGSKGIKAATRKHVSRPSIVPDAKQQERFEKYAKTADPYLSHRRNLQNQHADKLFPLWLWQTECNFSVLVHGVGSKRALLKRFTAECLSNSDVIAINGDEQQAAQTLVTGASGNKVMRELLDTIWTDVCGHPKIKGFDNLGLMRYVDTVVDALLHRYRTAIPLIATSADSGTAVSVGDTSITTASSVGADGEGVRGPGAVPLASGDVYLDPRGAIAKSLGLDDYNNDGANQRRGAVERTSGLDAKLASDRDLRRGMGLGSSKSLPGGGERIYGRYTHNYHRLYLVVHSLDAEILRTGEFQHCLSLLSACPCVALVASIDHLNTPLLWDTEMLALFRWSYQHAPTFECNGIRDSELFSSIKGKNGGSRALEYIMRSLTTKHRDIMSHLARLELERKSRVATRARSEATQEEEHHQQQRHASSNKAVTLAELLDVCTSKLIVRNEQDLRYHLKEPMDHRILSISSPDAETGAIYISIYLPVEILETLVA